MREKWLPSPPLDGTCATERGDKGITSFVAGFEAGETFVNFRELPDQLWNLL